MSHQKYEAEHDKQENCGDGKQLFGVAFGLFGLSGADALAYHGQKYGAHAANNGPANVIDGKGHGVGGDEYGAKGGNQTGNQDLANMEHAAFHAVGQTDPQHPAHDVKVQPEMQQFGKMHRQLFAMGQGHAPDGEHHAAEGGGDGCACHTQVEAVDQCGVADHIDHIKSDGGGNSLAVLAHGAQDRGGGVTHSREGVAQQGDGKIGDSVFQYIGFDIAVDHMQNGLFQGKQHQHQHSGNSETGVEQLIGADAALLIVPAAHILGSDHAAAHGDGRKHGNKQNVDGIHQRNGADGSFTGGGYHGGIHHACDDRKQGIQNDGDHQPNQRPVGE